MPSNGAFDAGSARAAMNAEALRELFDDVLLEVDARLRARGLDRISKGAAHSM